MGIKKQFSTLKENWLLVLLVLVLFIFFNSFSGGTSSLLTKGMSYDQHYGGVAEPMMAVESSYAAERSFMPMGSADFAPEIEDRLLTKNTHLTSEVGRGQFDTSVTQIKTLVNSVDGFLLNEQMNTHDKAQGGYKQGSYTVKVDVRRYEEFVTGLRNLGTILYFTENTDDVTGQNVNLRLDVDAERARLARYKALYEEAEDINDKIALNDQIFNQERRIKYIEDSLNNLDQRIAYATVHITLQEEKSGYVTIAFVKISDLVRRFVLSINVLLSWIVVFIPWFIVGWVIYKISKRNKKKR